MINKLNGIEQQLTAKDGHCLNAYLCHPATRPRGAIVVLHEIFGLSNSILDAVDQFAELGYVTIAPALFDRAQKNCVFSIEQSDQARALASKCEPEKILLDIEAAQNHINLPEGVSVVGYCWGGTFAYLSACKLSINSAVSYYGTRITSWLDYHPKHPIQFHFGAQDKFVPQADIDQIRAANPYQPTFVYESAGHAFAAKRRDHFHAKSASLAEQRTLEFIDKTRRETQVT